MSVDWELLAQHLSGALAGTPEQEEVAQRVASDPEWARAAEQLDAALEVVAGDLDTFATALRTPPAAAMPDDVTQRLDAALAAAPTPATTAHTAASAAAAPLAEEGKEGRDRAGGRSSAGPHRPAGPAGTRPGSVPAGTRPGSTPSSDRRSRRGARRSAWLAAAAGVLVFAVFSAVTWGVSERFLGPTPDTSVARSDRAPGGESGESGPDSDSSGRGASPADGEPAPSEIGGRPRVLATGTDYDESRATTQVPYARPTEPGTPEQREGPGIQDDSGGPEESIDPGTPGGSGDPGNSGDSDGEGPQPDASTPGTLATDPGSGTASEEVSPEIPSELQRLWRDQHARNACLLAVRDALSPSPVALEAMDFAQFHGDASLMVWAVTGDGERWVMVVGPECGTTAAGAHERYSGVLQS